MSQPVVKPEELNNVWNFAGNL